MKNINKEEIVKVFISIEGYGREGSSNLEIPVSDEQTLGLLSKVLDKYDLKYEKDQSI